MISCVLTLGRIMKRLEDHSNVVRLIGVCARAVPAMLLTELAVNKDLRTYLIQVLHVCH